MSQATPAEIDAATAGHRDARKLNVAGVLGNIVFASLLCLIVLTAIPYGASQAWWKAFFACAVFTLAILWLVESLLSGSRLRVDWSLVLPVLALALFSLLQTVPLGKPGGQPGGITLAPWNAISADPYQTRFFVLMLLGLTLAGVLLARYASSEQRWRILINVIIAVAVASALFGILRQTTQHSLGFGLPLLVPDSGYGQFINYNHFAYLMEMALGLILGMVLGGGVKRDQGLIYFAALLPIWVGLVLCGSRGGLVAMLAQLITAALLFSVVNRAGNSTEARSRALNIAQSLPVRLVLVLVLILGVVIGTLWLGGDRLAFRIEDSRREFSAEQNDLRQRIGRNEVWGVTWKMFKAHPIFGVGMDGYWAAVPAFHDASGTMTPQEAHNDYLELLASGGLVGLALGVWFAMVVLKRMRVNLNSPNRFRRAACFGAAIGIAGVAVHSLVDFGLHMIVNALVFTTLIVIATSKSPWESEKARRYD